MNKFLFKVLTLLIMSSGVFFTSCSDDDDQVVEEQKVTVLFSAKPMVEGTLSQTDFEGMKVVFTEVRSQDTTLCILNNAGTGTVKLYKSTYNVAIEETIENEQGAKVVVSVRMENLSVNQEGQTIEGLVNSLPAEALGKNFIMSEVFFNGERNSGQMMHPDQYFVIFNPTQETLYADGVCFALTHHMSRNDKAMWYDEYYPTRVPVSGFLTIPGNGKEHPVAPGEKLVVAFTAIDHSKVEGYDHAVDLTGADFEFYEGPDSKDVDNPEVPNVLLTENTDGPGFFLQPRGYYSPLLFKLENGEQATVEKFVKENTSRSKTLVPANEETGTPEEIIEINILSVNTESILDGIQTSDVPRDVKTRVIPETVDRGKFLVNGCHRQELCIRKKIEVGNKIFYQDTNNSTEDIEMQLGQNSFPKGWRNK